MKKKTSIGLTYGDPASIGPEILLKVLKKWNYKGSPIVIGSKEHLGKSFKKNNGTLFHSPKSTRFKTNKPSKHTGKFSYLCIEEAAKLAKLKKIKALVTGPVSKTAINLAGVKFKGQTDTLARLCNKDKDKVIMLFVSNDLKIALFTRHIPLNKVSSKLTKAKLKSFLINLNNELKHWFKIKNPKIAILGLNPHAGENGIIGKEEQNIIIPVIKQLSSKLKLYGPLSPDAALAKAGHSYLSNKKQDYDVYVSLYHDQALPMFKAIAGLYGVNVTLGLPFLRVSVDHGTAFDIAHQNKASDAGLRSAIKLAEQMLS